MVGWNGLEGRLFGWLLVLALVPVLALLAAVTWLWTDSLDWVGTLGPWGRVAESGRALFLAAEAAAVQDSTLAEALARHRGELSESLVLARRWVYLAERIGAALPVLALALAAGLAALAFAASRRLAQSLARPIAELVGWAERLGREERLPPPGRAEAGEVREVRVLRESLRRAADERAAARLRALDAERVSAWGEMARRIAHEMKNPLTPLRLAAHRLAREANGNGVLEESVAVITEETARLEELAQHFGALGRPPEGPRSEVDLGELLASLVASDVPAAIDITLDIEPDLPRLDAHYDSLLRAFRNLLRNAVEATAGDGAPGAARRIEVWARASEADWIEVGIADAGRGLPTGSAERIFEPDFTTKVRGTGLGLALVRQAVAAHGGAVRARTRPESGAEFVVRLPAAGVAALRA